jgi:hypothetical protein
VRQSLVSREFVVCLLGTLDPKHILTNHLSLCGPKFPYRWFLVRVVLKRRRRKDGPNCGVCVSLFGIISKRRRERETSEERSGCKGHHRPQNHPNSEHTRSRERERESCCFRASSFSSFGRPLFLFLKALNGARVPLRI